MISATAVASASAPARRVLPAARGARPAGDRCLLLEPPLHQAESATEVQEGAAAVHVQARQGHRRQRQLLQAAALARERLMGLVAAAVATEHRQRVLEAERGEFSLSAQDKCATQR